MKKYVLAVLFAAVTGWLLVPGPNNSPLAAEKGETIVEDRCTVCHDTGRIERAGHDRKGWENTVARMMGKSGFGSELGDDEYQALLDYLTSLSS